MEKTRDEALAQLLKPIRLTPSSGLRARQNYVIERKKRVRMVMPFLNTTEQQAAQEFLAEDFSSLWD